MTANTTDETRYRDRSDGVPRKIALLEAARARGDYDLASALADSLKDGLAAERLLDGANALAPDFGPDGWRPVAELPDAWARWAAGWSLCPRRARSTARRSRST